MTLITKAQIEQLLANGREQRAAYAALDAIGRQRSRRIDDVVRL
jgi:hypothetical protein